MTSSLQISDAESAAVQKTPHRVSLADIEDSIGTVDYIRPAAADYMTIAVVVMKNGYVVLGKSAPADPDNFNQELGEKFAREDAIRQIWPLMGFALRDKLAA